jgi:ClpP class serine protease
LRPPFIPVGVPHRAVTDEERKMAMEAMKSLYSSFVSKVAQTRSLSSARTEELAQGRVWTGVEAKNNGLVDRIGGLHDAIMIARELAEIGPEEEADVVEYGSRGLFRSPFDALSISSPWSTIASVATFGAFEVLAAHELMRDGKEAEEEAPADYDLLYLQELIRNNGRGLCMLPPDFLPREEGR